MGPAIVALSIAGVGYSTSPYHISASAQVLPTDQMAVFGISRTTAELKRYDFATGQLTPIGVVTDDSNRVLTGIEASAYIPGHMNIYGFWMDPNINKVRLVYVNILTGKATFVGGDLGSSQITGATALDNNGTGQWQTYGVRRVDLGLVGGHFDVDTSTTTGNSTDAHVHQYDDKFNTKGLDAFGYFDSKLLEINEVIPNNERFELITVNANLSSAAQVSINNNFVMVDPSDGVLGIGPYSLGDTAGTTKLTDLRIEFPVFALPNGGLVPTETKFVRNNDPGPNGEYRSGAFTVQAVRVNADGSPAYTLGTNGAATSGFLWETTVFWHTKDPNAVVSEANITGELVRIDHQTGATTSLMTLERPYESLASIDGNGTLFYGTNGSELYLIDLTTNTETLIGTVPAAMPAMEFAVDTLIGSPAGDYRLRLLDSVNGGESGSPLNVGMSDLGTIIFAPIDSVPRIDGYD